MPRPPRSFVPGGVYHLVARGNGGCAIYIDDVDRETFLRFLQLAAARWRLELHAFALLTNHYHLVVTTPDGRISEAMRWLNWAHACRFNRRHERSGHLFRARFRATEIRSEEHFERACAYVLANRDKAGLEPDVWTSAGSLPAVGTAA